MNKELYEFMDEDTVLMPDYEDALISVTSCGNAVYEYYKMLKILMDRDGMTEEEAADYISYNTMRALPYAGEKKPIIIYGVFNNEEVDL